MANIVKHIEHLLLTNDCVILPEFGGFIAHHVPAHYDEKESMFIPAQRSLGFNPRLTMNDSILVQSYVEAYAMSYPDAMKEMEQDIENIRMVLSEKKRYDFGTVGTLSMSGNGYDFQPNSSGLLTPSLYGFGALEVETLEMLRRMQRQNAFAMASDGVNTVFTNDGKSDMFDRDSNEEPPYVITIQRKTVRRAMMTAAAVALALLVSLPVKFSVSQNEGLLKGAVTTTLPVAASEKKAVKTEAAPKTFVAKPAEKPAAVEAKPAAQAINERNYYSIVMANGITRAGAEYYASKLKTDDGITTTITDGDKPMVLFGKFATAEEAQAEILRHKDCKKFDIAWVYNVRVKN